MASRGAMSGAERDSKGVDAVADFDIGLFKTLNEEYRDKPVVPEPRVKNTAYTGGIGGKRGQMLERKIGLAGKRVLEIGCGDGMLSRALARDCGCDVVGVDIVAAPAWAEAPQRRAEFLVHDVSAGGNARLGTFDRIVSFAVFEHIVHPHAALSAAYELLKPSGKAYIYANLYRGAKASHRYREVFFPWPHLLFREAVWRQFYLELTGEPQQAAWVNKLTYDQYLGMAGRVGFDVAEHFPSAPFFDEAFYRRFESQLSAYPRFDLMHDFIHLVLEKPERPGAGAPSRALRRSLAERAVRPYDRISYWPMRMTADEAKHAMAGEPFEVLGQTYALSGETDYGAKDLPRSRRLFMHSWHFFEPLLAAIEGPRDTALIAFLTAKACEWIDRYGGEDLERDTEPSEGPESDFVGAGTAIANRYYRLAFLVCAAAASPAVGDADFEKLVGALLRHRDALADDTNFMPHSNHGILQALAQIAGSSRFAPLPSGLGPGMAVAMEQGRLRLKSVLAQQFGADHVLKEHTVSYHLALAQSVGWITSQGIVADEELQTLVDGMHAAGRWMYDSAGRIANLGDTDLEPDLPGAALFRDAPPEEQFAAAAFRDSGFWFVKGAANGGTYVALTASFHSRVHKQADTASFLWRDRGLEILVDAGRYGYAGRTKTGDTDFRNGYWYSDPRRIYVESSRAHNTVNVDGQDHPRFRSKPYGSSIAATAQKDGVFACECAIANLPRMTHFRVLALRPGEWLLCIDSIRAADGESHLVRQNFHLHPDWQANSQHAAQMIYSHLSGVDLHVSCVLEGAAIGEVARGRGIPGESPAAAMSGWWSPRHMQIEPCNAMTVASEGQHVTMATLFTFAPAEIDRAVSGHNTTRRRFRFRWTCGSKSEMLTLDRGTSPDGVAKLEIL